MEKKIFRTIFAVAFGVLIVNTIAFVHVLYTYYIDDKILKELGVTSFALVLSILKPIVIIAAGLLVVATIVASNVAKKIVEPINAINLDKPEETEVYEELSPLLVKINKQSRQLQRQIREATQKQIEFVTITENMNEGILVVDTKYEVLSYNKAIVDMLANGEAPNTKSVFAFNRSNKFRKLIKKALNGKSKERVLEIKDKSYEIMASPVYESKKIVGAVIIVMDVTEKMQRDNYRREFTANVSHELKTPLTSISGFAEIMKNGLVKPEDIPDMASSIYDEAQRLIVLVNDIIKLSALEDERLTYENEKINVIQLLEEIQGRLSNVISSKNIDFLIDKNEDNNDIVIEAPREIVTELFYNLCDNAIKYNKQDGKVRVYVGRDRRKCIVSVSDTGIGIAPEHLERVFERFYRVDKSHSKEVGGTGLGLSIVKHNVNYLDGSISIDSKVDEGSEISVTIPVALVS